MDRGDLTDRLGALARELQSESGSESTLSSIVAGAVSLVPGARWAGISHVEGRRVVPRVPSDPVVAELDEMQSDLDEGPCLTALRDHATIHVEDMQTERRWPRFSRAALRHGVHSMLSFRLFVSGGTMGALNLYATESGVFDDDSTAIGHLVAQHASIAMAAVAADAQFQLALGSRDLIGQAKGMLMERFTINDVHAFHLLVRLSQEQNVKVVEVARRLVDGHNADVDDTKPTP